MRFNLYCLEFFWGGVVEMMIWLLGAIFMLMVIGACVHRYCGGEGQAVVAIASP